MSSAAAMNRRRCLLLLMMMMMMSVLVLTQVIATTTDNSGRSHKGNVVIKDTKLTTPTTTAVFRSSSIVSKIPVSTKDRNSLIGNNSRNVERGGAQTTTTTTTTTTATATATATATTTNNNLPKAIIGAIVFGLIEKTVKVGLQLSNVQYPAQLGACIVLFLVLCILDSIGASSLASNIYTNLIPGAALLAKWFPIFFVPGLVLLPLSPPIGTTMDVFKVLLTVVIGFVYSLTSTLLGVSTVRTIQGKSTSQVATTTTPSTKTTSRSSNHHHHKRGKVVPITSTKPKAITKTSGSPFSEAQWTFCWKVTVLSGLVSVLTTTQFAKSTWVSPLQMIFTFFITVTSYIWGSRLPSSFVKLCHPLVTSSIVTLSCIRLLAYSTNRDYIQVLKSYKTGTLSPFSAGAGDYLLYLLGPGVVAFAISVYGRKSLLFNNLPMVLTAMMISSIGSLFATGAFVRLIQLGGPNGKLVRLSVLARNVTMALAMALTDMIGGDVAIIALVVCLTGIIGASYGIPLLDAMGVTDPIARGLGIGSSAQGLGVASIAGEPDAFAFASVAMVLTAVAGTTFVSFPAVRNALIRVTTGQ